MIPNKILNLNLDIKLPSKNHNYLSISIMKNQISTLLVGIFALFLFTGCSKTNLNTMETKVLGKWSKDWSKSIKYVESRPEIKKYLFGLKMLNRLQKLHEYNFKKDKTFDLSVGGDVVQEYSKGNWSITKDSIFTIETVTASSHGFAKRDSLPLLRYKIISFDEKTIEMRQLHGASSEFPEFLNKIK